MNATKTKDQKGVHATREIDDDGDSNARAVRENCVLLCISKYIQVARMRIKWKPLFSLSFFSCSSAFPWWRVTQILWEEIGANSGRSFPKISTFCEREKRERERERDFMGGKSSACIKLLVRASKVRESFPKDNRKLLLKGGPGSRMKQRETTTEEEK